MVIEETGQRARCQCCGEFLGPEHTASQKRNQEIRKALGVLKRARETHNGYLGAQAVEQLAQLLEEHAHE